jgi:histidinol-phosphate/aromatic aminotransferase/cobyric acid decarboxylase-like protein
VTAGRSRSAGRAGDYGYPPFNKRWPRTTGVAPENVVTAAGTSMANMLAMAAILEPGDEVLVEQPTYELLLAALGYLQAEIRRFPRRVETGFALDPAEIDRAITPRTRLIVITNLHNPSSAFTGQETLRAVGAIARSVGARVLVGRGLPGRRFPPGAPAFAFTWVRSLWSPAVSPKCTD